MGGWDERWREVREGYFQENALSHTSQAVNRDPGAQGRRCMRFKDSFRPIMSNDGFESNIDNNLRNCDAITLQCP